MTASATYTPSPEAFARAARRACESGIMIAGRGYRKSDHAPVYAVTSASDPSRWYLVVVETGRLVCNCKGGQHDVYCKHRYLVHETMLSERAASRRIAQQQATYDAMVMDMEVREAQRASAPLAVSNAPFSIFKS